MSGKIRNYAFEILRRLLTGGIPNTTKSGLLLLVMFKIVVFSFFRSEAAHTFL